MNDTFNYKKDIIINEHDLNNEIIRQPQLFYEVSTAAAQANGTGSAKK